MKYYNKYKKYKAKYLNLSKINNLEGGLLDWTFDISPDEREKINNIIDSYTFDTLMNRINFFQKLKTNNLSYFDILYTHFQ